MASILILLLKVSLSFSERKTGIPQITGFQITCVCSIKMRLWKMCSGKLVSILCVLGSIGILALAPWVIVAQRPKTACTQDLFHQNTCQRWANPWIRTLLTHLTRCVYLGEGRDLSLQLSNDCWNSGSLINKVFPVPSISYFSCSTCRSVWRLRCFSACFPQPGCWQ